MQRRAGVVLHDPARRAIAQQVTAACDAGHRRRVHDSHRLGRLVHGILPIVWAGKAHPDYGCGAHQASGGFQRPWRSPAVMITELALYRAGHALKLAAKVRRIEHSTLPGR
jgi:hypothetical protein